MTVPAYMTKRDRRRNTFGGDVADVCRELGWVPMAYQEAFWDTALEYRKSDLGLGHVFVRDQACATLPRQNGKSVALLSMVAWAGKTFDNLRMGWVAQERIVAVGLIEELFHRCMDAGWDVSFKRTAGQERIVFHDTGSWVRVLSATERAGHGASWDIVVGDETWALQWKTLQSIVPAQSGRPSSLLCMISTQGTEESSVLNDFVERGRNGDPLLTYMEFSAPDGVDVFDPNNWELWMPALTQGSFMTVEKIASGAAVFSSNPSEFIRAYANKLVRSDASIFDAETIEAVLGADVPSAPERVTFGVDLSTKPTQGSLVASWWDEDADCAYVVLLDRQSDQSQVGRDLNERLYAKPTSQVVIAHGPAVMVKPEVSDVAERYGARFSDLNQSDLAAASMRFNELVREGKLFIADANDVMRHAMDGTRLKRMGTRWTIDRDVPLEQSSVIASAIAVHQAWADTFEPRVAIY